MPRKLTFRVDNGNTLHIDVSARRVFRLVGVDTDEDTSKYQLAFAGRNQENLKAQTQEIAQVVAAFVARSGEMSVTSRQTSTDYRSSEVGFASAELRTLCEKIGVSTADEVASAPVAKPEVIVEIEEPDVEPVQSAEADIEAAAVEEKFEELSEELDDDDQPSLASLEERLKSVAAAVGDVAKPLPKQSKAVPQQAPAVTNLEEYFEACKACAINGVLLASDGAVLAVFGRGVQENWLDIAGHASVDFKNWIDVAGWALGKTQLLVLKGPHFEDSSIAILFMDDKYAAITMRNLDLNKVMKLGMEVLAQVTKG
ncbi:MAG: hypothetical protein ABI459_07250 [Deltaproteobacteria bacterium]